ncbi:cytochrome P450, partial [Streptomyces sp. DSM 41634]|uniref:cytochrome P450 n=1 Tax=Streptomyces sp. DSM 41634 TaxID=3448656 RepID=UPI0040403231
PDAVSGFVNELLRVNPIGDGGPLRISLEEVEIAGTVIPKRSAVMAAVASANRDAQVFEDGEEFRPDREHNPHLAFGHGIHHCLGKHLGRMEMEIALTGLVSRLPELRLAVAEAELPWHVGEINHTLTSLPVAWGA